MKSTDVIDVPESGLEGEPIQPPAGIARVLIPPDVIQRRVLQLAREIAKDTKHVHAVVVMKGAVIFFEDLRRALEAAGCKVLFDTVTVKSYAGTASTGKVDILQDAEDLAGKDVLLVEDIVDTGLTMEFLKQHLFEKGAHSVKICTLLQKPARLQQDIPLDYIGFTIPDLFVVGYGMDHEEQYRELEYVGVIEESTAE